MTSPADRLVYALKYGGWPRLGADLGDRMAQLPEASPYLQEGARIVPVPTTPGRLRRRGYNQAQLLAERVADRVGGRLVQALERSGNQRSQVKLGPGERSRNVSGAFSLRHGGESMVRGSDLVLVDDVLTTGATACAAATALIAGGAASVRLLTFARSLPDQ